MGQRRKASVWSWVDQPREALPKAAGPGRYSRPWSMRETLVARSIGAEIRRLRLAANMTVYELADRLGISQPYVSTIENAEKPIDVAFLFDLADIFDVPTTHFIEAASGEIERHPLPPIRKPQRG